MLTDITLGQYFPGNSFIHKLDPRTKLLATLIYIIAIFFAVTPLAYGILTAFDAVVILISRVPWMLVFKSLKPIWIIVILTMLIHMFTAPGEHIVFTWKFLSVTAEGIDMGVKMAVRLILLLLFSSALTTTISSGNRLAAARTRLAQGMRPFVVKVTVCAKACTPVSVRPLPAVTTFSPHSIVNASSKTFCTVCTFFCF